MKKITSTVPVSILIVFICILIAFVIGNGEVFWHQQKWNSANISHYRIRLSRSCFCGDIEHSSASIEVQNGKIISTSDKAGPSETIDSLFSYLRRIHNRRVESLEVKYDPIYGFPSHIFYDSSKDVMDDEMGFDILKFEVLP
ncbi:MAG: DUF6174 domain-containing protein [Chloroflexota bacterium]